MHILPLTAPNHSMLSGLLKPTDAGHSVPGSWTFQQRTLQLGLEEEDAANMKPVKKGSQLDKNACPPEFGTETPKLRAGRIKAEH